MVSNIFIDQALKELFFSKHHFNKSTTVSAIKRDANQNQMTYFIVRGLNESLSTMDIWS